METNSAVQVALGSRSHWCLCPLHSLWMAAKGEGILTRSWFSWEVTVWWMPREIWILFQGHLFVSVFEFGTSKPSSSSYPPGGSGRAALRQQGHLLLLYALLVCVSVCFRASACPEAAWWVCLIPQTDLTRGWRGTEVSWTVGPCLLPCQRLLSSYQAIDWFQGSGSHHWKSIASNRSDLSLQSMAPINGSTGAVDIRLYCVPFLIRTWWPKSGKT